MKIHQTISLVVGVHALAFLLIFVSPGCSSTAKTETAGADSAGGAAAPAPVVAAAAAPAAAPAADATATPLLPVGSSASPSAPVFYSPTRPNTAAAEALTPSAPAPDVTPAETYTVRSGDSLWLVAHRHHVKVSELAAANNLRSTSALHTGQKLLIPQAASAAPARTAGAAAGENAPAATASAAEGGASESGTPGKVAGGTKYTVKAGDKLSSIARHFGLTTGALAAENNISDPRKIRPGQVLNIPAGGAAHKSNARKGRSAAHPAEAESAPAAAPAPASAAPMEPMAPSAAPMEPAPSASGSGVPIFRIDGGDAGSSAPSSAPGK